MKYYLYKITGIQKDGLNTAIIQCKPESIPIPTYIAGQYVYIKNPTSRFPEEPHPFSIASSPTNKELEFCIKKCGDWTEEIQTLKPGSKLWISEARGYFTYKENEKNITFLVGGIGIAPIISILRFITISKEKPNSLTLIYGNRNKENVVYSNEITKIIKSMPILKVINVYSHLQIHHPWKGYRGFITKDLIEHEIDLSLNPAFFYIGPPIFISKIDQILGEIKIRKKKRYKESLI